MYQLCYVEIETKNWHQYTRTCFVKNWSYTGYLPLHSEFSVKINFETTKISADFKRKENIQN